jgi:hypothetical protein
MMHQFVHIFAEQFLALKTESTYSQPIDEGAIPFEIQSPDPLTGGIQECLPMLHLPFDLWYRYRHLLHSHLQSRKYRSVTP